MLSRSHWNSRMNTQYPLMLKTLSLGESLETTHSAYRSYQRCMHHISCFLTQWILDFYARRRSDLGAMVLTISNPTHSLRALTGSIFENVSLWPRMSIWTHTRTHKNNKSIYYFSPPATPPFKPVLASPDDTSNFSVHDEEDEVAMPATTWSMNSARKELDGRNTPFIGYTCLKNVGIPMNDTASINSNHDTTQFNREDEILKLKRQLETTFRANRAPILKIENTMEQSTLHSSQWMPKNRLQP